jgi:hypothetical protein
LAGGSERRRRREAAVTTRRFGRHNPRTSWIRPLAPEQSSTGANATLIEPHGTRLSVPTTPAAPSPQPPRGRRRNGGRPPSPKGLRPPAQGRPNGMRPTLGMSGVTIEPQSGSGRDGWESGVWGATPLGLKGLVGCGPKVAVWRPQPWAGGRERRRRRKAALTTRRRANRDSD